MNKRLRIAVDMDEVLADTLGKQLRLYNHRYADRINAEDLHGIELADIVPPDRQAWVLEMLHAPGYFADLEPMPGGPEAMGRLCTAHDVYIASAATEFPGSFNDKLKWLERYLPQIPRQRIIFCGEKSVLNVDILVDDTPQHFQGLCGLGLLFDAPHNRHQQGHLRVRNWLEAEAAIAKHSAGH